MLQNTVKGKRNNFGNIIHVSYATGYHFHILERCKRRIKTCHIDIKLPNSKKKLYKEFKSCNILPLSVNLVTFVAIADTLGKTELNFFPFLQ